MNTMKSTSFINFTNHPSSQWSESQILAAKSFGEIIDLPFPSVDPFCDEEEIEQLAKQYVDKITDNNPVAVLCQGEYSPVSYTHLSVGKLNLTFVS